MLVSKESMLNPKCNNINLYKGLKVKVKSLEWYNKYKDKYGDIFFNDNPHFFSPEMKEFCDKILTIEYKFGSKDILGYEYYFVEENGFFWTKEMFDIYYLNT